MKHVYRLILFCTMMAVFGVNAQTVTIGAGATVGGTNSDVGVIYRSSASSSFDYSQQYFLYTAAEMAAAGIPPGSIISSVAWYKTTANGTTTGNTSDIWDIYMQNTATAPSANWSNTTFSNQTSGATLVYSSNSQVIPASIGWVTLNLTAPFIYTGGSLEIGSSWNCSGYSGSPSTGSYQWAIDAISDQCFGNASSVVSFSMVSQTSRPQIQLSYVPGTPCAGTPTAGTAVSSISSICPSTPFDVSLSGNTLASGLTYQWQSSTDGTTYTDIAGATNSAYSATQTVDTYYQCIVTCTASSLSSTSTPVLVLTDSFLNCYCTSSATSASFDEIFNVTLGALNSSSDCNTVAGPGSVASMYSDYTNTTPATTIPYLLQGVSTPMSVTTGTCGTSSLFNALKVYIDYNHNGQFTDLGEEVYFTPAATNSAHTESFNIIAPATAMTGITRMRVVYYYTSVVSAAVPCGTYSYGETEDYLVSINTPLAVDAGISEFVTPTLPTCNFTDSTRVVLTNYGTSTLTSATINLSLNGAAPISFPWSGSLPSFASETVNIGLIALSSGMSLTASTTMPNGVAENAAGSWNDSTSIAALTSGLSGNYTIGGTAPDYIDFASALADLNLFGTCGPVIFDVRDGVYAEQLSLIGLPSMDSTSTVTFRGESGDASLATIEYGGSNATDNWVVNFDAAPHYRFENLTIKSTGASYARVLDFIGGNYDINIEGCILEAPTSTSTSNLRAVIHSPSNSEDNGIHFINNTITGGSYGVYFYGSSSSYETGNVFEGNNFHANYYRGVHIYYNDALKMNNNLFDGPSTYTSTRYAMYLYYTTGSPEVNGNTITGDASSGWTYGIYMNYGGGNNASYSKINNNMISCGWSGYTGTLYGISLNNSGYVDVHHNSVLTAEGGTSSRAFYATGGGGVDVKNNIFADYTGGYALYINSTFSVTNSDYNVLYSPSGNIGYLSGAQASLTDWQNAASFDVHSIDYNPNFFSTFDLHVCNDSIGNQGTPIASVTMDIDGHQRSATAPDMGADEFNGLNGSFLGNDLEVCANDSIQLWAGSPTDTILWSTGETTSSIWVSSPGSYTVNVQGACGSGVDAVVVSASAVNYTGYIAASNTSFCSGDSVLLYSTQAADSYTWTGGSVNDSLYVTAGGTYTLDIADDCGSGSQAITVTMNDVPNTSYSHITNYLTGSFTNTTAAGSGATYLWSFGDGNTSTAENPTHVYTNSGLYYATLTVTNACGSMTFGDTINLFVTGIEEVADFGTINVSPNPSNGVFNVNLELNEVMNLNMVVTNVMGQVVSTKVIDAATGTESTQIDLSTEAAGVYYLNILSGDKKLTNKMLVKK